VWYQEALELSKFSSTYEKSNEFLINCSHFSIHAVRSVSFYSTNSGMYSSRWWL